MYPLSTSTFAFHLLSSPHPLYLRPPPSILTSPSPLHPLLPRLTSLHLHLRPPPFNLTSASSSTSNSSPASSPSTLARPPTLYLLPSPFLLSPTLAPIFLHASSHSLSLAPVSLTPLPFPPALTPSPLPFSCCFPLSLSNLSLYPSTHAHSPFLSLCRLRLRRYFLFFIFCSPSLSIPRHMLRYLSLSHSM